MFNVIKSFCFGTSIATTNDCGQQPGAMEEGLIPSSRGQLRVGKGEKTMKWKEKFKESSGVWLLGAVIGCLLVLPGQVWALTDCTISAAAICGAPDNQDCDGDGFTNIQECLGFDPAAPDQFVPMPGFDSGLARLDRLDPAEWDVFIILEPASPGSLLPAEPFRYVSNLHVTDTDTGGLGITMHQLSAADVGTLYGAPDRRMTESQLALIMYENSWTPYVDPGICAFDIGPLGETYTEDDLIFGEAAFGSANDPGNMFVWTKSITDFVTCKYASKSATPPAGLIDDYIREVVGHEVGHHLKLTQKYNARFGGHHLKTGSGVIMEQSVKYTVKGSKVTFYTTEHFSDLSEADAAIR
jgi:hypothetical protein